jgi:hypothetical protein
MEELLGINLNKPVLKIKHSELKRIENDSPHKSYCPACKEGFLLMRRHPKSMMLSNIDNCLLCGQVIEYIDIPDNKIHYLNMNMILEQSGYKHEKNI